MLSTLSLILASCNGGGNLPPVQVTPVTQLSGTASSSGGWVQLIASDGAAFGAKVSTDASGNFSVDLTTPEASRLNLAASALSSLGCQGNLTSSDASAKGMGITSANSGGGRLMPAEVSKSLLGRTITVHGLIYSDRATTLSGQLDCGSLTGGAVAKVPVNVNIPLQAGWTPVRAQLNASIGLGGISASGSATTEQAVSANWITDAQLKSQLGF